MKPIKQRWLSLQQLTLMHCKHLGIKPVDILFKRHPNPFPIGLTGVYLIARGKPTTEINRLKMACFFEGIKY